MKWLGIAGVVLLLAVPVRAEDLVRREVLNEQPLSGAAGIVVIVSELKLMPGGRIPLHTHPGDEHAVIVVGGLARLPNGDGDRDHAYCARRCAFFRGGEVR